MCSTLLFPSPQFCSAGGNAGGAAVNGFLDFLPGLYEAACDNRYIQARFMKIKR